ncbi:MAG TPA: site-specific integrase [Candidatus Erysipelatoclostridium merdavium]|uniref:Site-specific integrase n=1 Tax=Candidatus Erysipelatoclostridium merdavium TaxID=2838566 RepID=A0A9D2BNL9_9FIRM|nr:site-specific integrase [Candidatus Erysipelatoclostridium merdavium]
MPIRKRINKRMKNGYVYEVYINYYDNGIKSRYSKSGFRTLKEAKNHEAIKCAELEKRGNIQKKCKKTFGQVYQEFLEIGCGDYQENTIISTKNMYKTFLHKDVSQELIINFNYAFLQNYFNSKAKQGLATNKNIKKAINRILDFGVKMGYIETNHINLVSVKGIDTTRNENKVISDSDFQLIIKLLSDKDTFKYQAYRISLIIGYYTGLRISEVLGLEKKDIDFQNNTISIKRKLVYKGLRKKEFHTTQRLKSKKSGAIIPMALPLKIELQKWFGINPYEIVVCDQNGCYINPNTMGQDIKAITNKEGIHFHYHMLRHTFSTKLVLGNVDVKTTQELMRHSNFNTTMSLYTHINDEHKQEVINTVFSK